MTKDLRLAVKREYFEAIASGEKTEEYREVKPYWKKRLMGKTIFVLVDDVNKISEQLFKIVEYDRVVITLGYPKKEETEKFLYFKYIGYRPKTIIHKHFGDNPIDVFAIDLSERIK